MAGLEPATPCSQSRCATKLRYIPGVLQPNGGGATTGSNRLQLKDHRVGVRSTFHDLISLGLVKVVGLVGPLHA